MFVKVARIPEKVRGRIQKFPDRVIMKYTLTTINTCWEATQRVTAAKLTRLTHKSSDTTAPNGRELYHLQFSLQAVSPETFGYPLFSFYKITALGLAKIATNNEQSLIEPLKHL
jgi:hypothetical protein